MKWIKPRAVYLLSAVVIFTIELCIALFVRDRFIRPYFGDVLVGILLWCAVRVILPKRPAFLSPIVLAFCFFVEFLQAIHIVELLSLEHIPFFVTLIGNSFSAADLVCYAGGMLPLFFIEWVQFRQNRKMARDLDKSDKSCYTECVNSNLKG